MKVLKTTWNLLKYSLLYQDRDKYSIYNIDIVCIIVAMLQCSNVIMLDCCFNTLLCWAVAAAGLQLSARSTGAEVITMQSNRNPRWQGIRLDSQSDSLRTHGIYGFIFITAIWYIFDKNKMYIYIWYHLLLQGI